MGPHRWARRVLLGGAKVCRRIKLIIPVRGHRNDRQIDRDAGRQEPAAGAGGLQRRRLRGRRAHEHLLQPARRWARRSRCSRTSWCARTRRSCTASASAGEREAFRQLIKISGVGPRTALAVLSGMSVADIAPGRDARRTPAGWSRCPASARRPPSACCWNSRASSAPTSGLAAGAATSDAQADILQALVALGYSDKEAAAVAQGAAQGRGRERRHQAGA